MSLGNTLLTLKVPLSTSDPFIGQPTCCKVLGWGGGGGCLPREAIHNFYWHSYSSV